MKMTRLLFLLTTLMLFAACANDDGDDNLPVGPAVLTGPGAPEAPRGPYDRTVLVYISGENNLSPYLGMELAEMREGSKGIGNNALVLYVDDANKLHNPYILWIKDGNTVDSLTLDTDPLSSSPKTMNTVLNYVSTYYPADEYGLVLWGHCTGWNIEDSVSTSAAAPRKAFGVDSGNNTSIGAGKWMNINTLAKTLWNWKHLRFIMADCCQFQCVELAYELRNTADFLIGSPAEIPGEGAPYETVTKTLFDTSETFYQNLVDRYFEQVIPCTYYEPGYWNSFTYDSQTPLSVIKTYELQNLADATHALLQILLPDDKTAWPDLSKQYLIYYCGNFKKTAEDCMYDMNDIVLHLAQTANTEEAMAAYLVWKEVFDRCVVYRKCPQEGWMSGNQIQPYVFKSGILNDARYGGVSMFVPQDRKGSHYYPYTDNGISYDGYNADIKKTSWYQAARLSDFGW